MLIEKMVQNKNLPGTTLFHTCAIITEGSNVMGQLRLHGGGTRNRLQCCSTAIQ
jgi:hypothetical protein